jgi:hypothetical protein
MLGHTVAQPIVAPIAMSRTSRRPIRVIVGLLDAAETTAYVVARSRAYAIHTTISRAGDGAREANHQPLRLPVP